MKWFQLFCLQVSFRSGMGHRIFRNFHDALATKVTPLYEIPYEDQLKVKYSRCRRILKDIGLMLRKSAKVHVGRDLLPCALEPVIASPVTQKYRNKDEFSIRHGADGNPKTVGLFLDSISENPNTQCVGADTIGIIKDSHKALAKDFENYIRQSSLDACINFSDGGHWRNIVVRSNMKEELMAVVIIHPQQLSVEQKEKEQKKLKEYFLSLEPRKYDLKSLYFQECPHTRCTSKESPFQLLFGNGYLYEKLNNLQFKISPESFFHTNTLAAERLMEVIFNLCQASKKSVIIDICCGTGSVSLTFAPHVKKCIGIDVSSQAIEDARTSAKINNIENVEFFVGKSESLIPDILNNAYGEEYIAIVNASGSCLGKSAIHALRYCKYLTKVLYVSSKPNAALQDFTDLCRLAEKDYRLGKPFCPMISVPMDMLPHTNHCLLAVLFQRL